MNDKSILALFEQRDERGIKEAGRAYGGLLRTVAIHILGDSRDAEECVNDTLMKAWLAIPPEKPKHFRAYLAKIARNLALNRYEAERAQFRGGGEVEAALDELSECIPASDNTEQVLDKLALNAALDSFLRSIPAQHAKVFMHRYFSMMNVGEIAAELDLSEGTVKSILRRTRAKLQTYLTKEGLL
ncbi:MAG: sigma-70 family RNA polymerase sigma factor [Oscillospiraceae bacterium]|nr:sigma-70 family RNA polymerase sigma factor [Oscillospiraceae bacterium]